MKKIWLVDDDRSLANLIQETLVRHGYEVYVFHEASHAMEEARLKIPDLILMDIMLPGVSGGQAVKILKNIPALKELPVVFLTGLISHEEDLEKTGINIDGKNYKTLGKPFGVDQLLQVVEEAVATERESR